jgi:heterodisulfide reductase subunit A
MKMNRHVIVIGGGVAGLEAAGQLARNGINVSLIERDERTGGHIRDWFKLFPDRRDSTDVIKYLDGITVSGRIKTYLKTTVTSLKHDKRRFSVMTDTREELVADAVIVASGFDLFRSARKEEYGYGIYDNVYTSADLEKMFRSGKILTHAGKAPESVGIVHCVGSRDEKAGNFYCSKLCCVTAVKQAIEIREHLPSSKVYCFYMDMRMGGAHYEEIYREAQEKWGVSFIRGKVSEAGETIDNRIVVKVEDTLVGRPLRMEVDMLILMAGMENSEAGLRLSENSGLKLGENRFFEASDNHFGSNLSNIEGLFYAGTCTAPMNITDTISHARSAVAETMHYLGSDQ